MTDGSVFIRALCRSPPSLFGHTHNHTQHTHAHKDMVEEGVTPNPPAMAAVVAGACMRAFVPACACFFPLYFYFKCFACFDAICLDFFVYSESSFLVRLTFCPIICALIILSPSAFPRSLPSPPPLSVSFLNPHTHLCSSPPIPLSLKRNQNSYGGGGGYGGPPATGYGGPPSRGGGGGYSGPPSYGRPPSDNSAW